MAIPFYKACCQPMPYFFLVDETLAVLILDQLLGLAFNGSRGLAGVHAIDLLVQDGVPALVRLVGGLEFSFLLLLHLRLDVDLLHARLPLGVCRLVVELGLPGLFLLSLVGAIERLDVVDVAEHGLLDGGLERLGLGGFLLWVGMALGSTWVTVVVRS